MPDGADEHVPDELDAYSRAVIAVAEAILPSVASLRVRGSRGEGAGSAGVISDDGHLLTSAHVVEGAKTVTASFGDGTEITAEVVGRDTLSDLAVLQSRGGHAACASRGATPPSSASGSWSSRWATRSGSPAASPPGSCPRSGDRCPPHPAG